MKKGLSILLILALLLTLPFTFASAEEDDTNKIALLSALEIMVGDPDGNFRPDDPVSRAEFAKIAVAAAPYGDAVAHGAPVSPFSDVPYTHWAAPYVLLAVNNGVVKGYTDATFRPDGTVLYEEAVTMLLHLLGYQDADFGLAWPYGQMATAKNIGLTDGVSATAGQPLNRREAMHLVYQLLKTPAKNGNSDYIETLGYSVLEDTVLIATAAEEVSVGAGKVLTSQGTYRMGDSYDPAMTGRRGDLVLKNRTEVKTFLPDTQQTETYTVYQTLSNEVMVLKNGTLQKLDVGNSLTVYHQGKGSTLSSFLNTLSAGDTLTVYKDKSGTPDYAALTTDTLVGPITVTSSDWLSKTGLSNPVILKNGKSVIADDVIRNDIIYYSASLNRVFAYRKQVTGIFEKTLPNRDHPTSVVVSGVTYTIEGVAALEALSSGGSVDVGASVTLLLGKSGGVADVTLPQGNVSGYLVETGTKSYETDAVAGTYSGHYATVVLPDGASYTYITDKDYDNMLNRVVNVSFDNEGVARLSALRSTVTVSGKFNAAKNRIGIHNLSPEIGILDVSTDQNKTACWTAVYPSRLDGVTLDESDVIYAALNDRGQITSLILKDVTGDAYDYVFVTKATETANDTFISGTYTYLQGGVSRTLTTNNKIFGIKGRTGARMTASGMGAAQLNALSCEDGEVTAINAASLVAGGVEYLISDRAEVYVRMADYSYQLVPIDSVSVDSGDFIVYHDGTPKTGGRVRIIVIE